MSRDDSRTWVSDVGDVLRLLFGALLTFVAALAIYDLSQGGGNGAKLTLLLAGIGLGLVLIASRRR